MIRVGIIGMGVMGGSHFKCYRMIPNIKIAAVSDIIGKKQLQEGKINGNIDGIAENIDWTDIKVYSDYEKMLAQANLDAVSITLPSHLHAEVAIKSLQAQVHVLCEKPMALNVQQCDDMITASEKTRQILQIAHCIRFWPEYAKTKEIIDSGIYGQVLAANFRRLSPPPIWASKNWLMDKKQSGGCILDLHIHDADFIQYTFGLPKSVRTFTTKDPGGNSDHIVTRYQYEDDKNIFAEASWLMAPGFGFEMSFNIMMEKASIIYDCTRNPTLRVCPAQGGFFTPEINKGDGYSREIEYFIKTINRDKLTEIITLSQARNSVRMIEAERISAATQKEIYLND